MKNEKMTHELSTQWQTSKTIFFAIAVSILLFSNTSLATSYPLPLAFDPSYPAPPAAPTASFVIPSGTPTTLVSTEAQLRAAAGLAPAYHLIINGTIDVTSTIYFTGTKYITGGTIRPRFPIDRGVRYNTSQEYCFAFIGCTNIIIDNTDFDFDSLSGTCNGIVFKDSTQCGIYNVQMTAVDESNLMSGIVTNGLCENFEIMNNILVGGSCGNTDTEPDSWDSYRAFGMFLVGRDFKIIGNTVKDFRLAGIKYGAAICADPNSDLYSDPAEYPTIPDNEKAPGELLSKNFLVQNNFFEFNGQSDTGCTGIIHNLNIYNNKCYSIYHQNRSYPFTVSIHLKSGYRNPDDIIPPDDTTRVTDGMIKNVNVKWNDCKANITIRSIDALYYINSFDHAITQVTCQYNTVTTGSTDSIDQSQGITLSKAYGGDSPDPELAAIRILDNTIKNTHSYAIAVSGTNRALIRGNTIVTSATPGYTQHYAHMAMGTLPCDGFCGWNHCISFESNMFYADANNSNIPTLYVWNNDNLPITTDKIHNYLYFRYNWPDFSYYLVTPNIVDYVYTSTVPTLYATNFDSLNLASVYTGIGYPSYVNSQDFWTAFGTSKIAIGTISGNNKGIKLNTALSGAEYAWRKFIDIPFFTDGRCKIKFNYRTGGLGYNGLYVTGRDGTDGQGPNSFSIWMGGGTTNNDYSVRSFQLPGGGTEYITGNIIPNNTTVAISIEVDYNVHTYRVTVVNGSNTYVSAPLVWTDTTGLGGSTDTLRGIMLQGDGSGSSFIDNISIVGLQSGQSPIE